MRKKTNRMQNPVKQKRGTIQITGKSASRLKIRNQNTNNKYENQNVKITLRTSARKKNNKKLMGNYRKKTIRNKSRM